jgi:hypothetical protein
MENSDEKLFKEKLDQLNRIVIVQNLYNKTHA